MPLTWVEINQENLNHNLDQFQKVAPQAEIWPVIKSNAYGHDFAEVAKVLDKNKNTTGFMVVNLAEAIALRKMTTKPIMVLSYFDQEGVELELAIHNRISLPIYDNDSLNYLNELGQRLKVKAQVNIKIDTGTSRLGYRTEEAVAAIKLARAMAGIEVFSIFTHFAESEAEDLSFTNKQLSAFKKIINSFPDIKQHSACSAASLSVGDARGDIIRLGLSLYGMWPSAATRSRGMMASVELRPVLSWRSKIIQLKNLQAGDTVGYNRQYQCKKACQVAVLALGYNEGYTRSLSNKAKVLIGGKLCPVRGNICMNLTMVELPEGIEVKIGDTATLIGSDKDKSVTADQLAQWAGTINYEIVTRINPQLPRVLV